MEVPLSIVAGDSISFLVNRGEYPAPTWRLRFTILSPAPRSFDSVASGTLHLISIAPLNSASIKVGRHGYALVWYTGPLETPERRTDGGGRILVLPDPTAHLEQTWAMQCLAKVEGAILKLSGTTNASVDVDGQTYTKRNFAELCNYRDRLISTVEAELIQLGRPVKRGGSKTIRTIFRG